MADLNLKLSIDTLLSPSFKRTLSEIESEFRRIESALAKGGLSDKDAVRSAEAYLGKLREIKTVANAIHVENERNRLSEKTGRSVEVHEVNNLLAQEREMLKLEKEQLRVGREQATLRKESARSVELAVRQQASAAQSAASAMGAGMEAAQIQRFLDSRTRTAPITMPFDPTSNAAAFNRQQAGLFTAAPIRSQTVDFDPTSNASNLRRAQAIGLEKQLGAAVEEVGTKAARAYIRLESFFLYRGFVFLQQGAINVTKALIDLDHQISLIQTQLPNFGAGMRGMLTEGIMQVARDTGQSFKSVADAEYQIVSAGVEAQESLRALAVTAKAATAGGTDMSSAFNSALAQMSAFGLGMDKLSHVYDLQFNLVKRGIFTYEQFAKVSAVVAEAMDNAGQSIETSNAALAAISRVFTGPQINRGATALRNLALAMANHPERFSAIGVSVTDIEGNFRNLIPILDDVEKRLVGLSDKDRAAILNSLVPEIKGGQGLAALLGQMDALKNNYIEQELALGDLDKAYGVVEADIKTQGQQLQNSIQTGFKPMADAMGGLIGFLSGMEKAMPGVTSQIIIMTSAMAALALVQSRLGQAGATGFLADISRGKNGRMSALMRGGLATVGVLGTAGSAYGASQEEGVGFGNYVTGAMSGGLAGSALGPWGIAGGAIAGAFLVGIGDLMEGPAEKAGMTLADAFAKELKNNNQSTAEALAKAEGQVVEGEKVIGTLAAVASGKYMSGTTDRNDVRKFKNQADAAAAGYLAMSHTGNTVAAYKLTTEGDLREGALAAYAAVMAKQEETRNTPQYKALEDDDDDDAGRNSLLDKAREDALVDIFPFSQAAAAFTALLLKSSTTVEGFTAGLDAGLSGNADAFLKWRGAVDVATDDFAEKIGEFGRMFSGPFDKAADVMEKLGTEGSRLAYVFHQLSMTTQSMALLESLKALKAPETAPVSSAISAAISRDEAHRQRLIDGGVKNSATTAAIATLTRSIERNQGRLATADPNARVLTGNTVDPLQAVGIDHAAVAGILSQRAMDTVVGGLGGQISNESFADALMQMFAPQQAAMEAEDVEVAEILKPVELGSNSFADSLFQASDLVRSGMMDGLGYTADQLEMLGEEFQTLNKIVAKVGLVRELENIGQFLFGPNFNLNPVVQSLYDSAKLGGKNLMDILSDPAKLVDLLADMEFGDISVDQSTKNNIVVRIDGNVDLNTANAALLADNIIAQLGTKIARRGA